MYPREALKTLYNIGAVKEEDFPYNIEMNKIKEMVDDDYMLLEVLANECKISNYARLYDDNDIKSFIYTNKVPILCCIPTDKLQLDKNNIIKIPTKYGNMGHAILIKGWNKDGYIIQNSWGKNWGNSGTAILPYDYKITEAWGITFDNDSNIAKPRFRLLRKILTWIISKLR